MAADNCKFEVKSIVEEVTKFQFLWTIANYSEERDTIVLTDCTKCENGIVAINGFVGFQLLLYPNGISTESGNKSTTTVELSNIFDTEAWVVVRFALLDKNYTCDYEHFTGNIYSIDNSDPGQRYPDFFPIVFSDDEKERFLPNGCLTILVQGLIWTNRPKVKHIQNKELLSDNPYCLPPFACTSDDHADIIIVLEDKNFSAHKMILGSRSSVLRKLIVDAADDIVEISDIKANVFEEVLHFIYTDSVRIGVSDMLLDLIKVAHTYELHFLKFICELKLVDKISTENVFEFLRLSQEIQSEELKATALTVLQGNKSTICKQSSWKKFKSDPSNFKLLGELCDIFMM